MKIIQMYQCKHKGCTHLTADYNEALTHEANHYNIDLPTYQQWDLLKTKVNRLASNLLDHNNDDSDKEYNDAVEKLIKFETDNGIGKKVNADDVFGEAPHLLTNFYKSEREIYEKAIAEYGDDKLKIHEEAYNKYGNVLEDCLSLHYYGPKNKLLDEFWAIQDRIEREMK